ncbi:MAG TPA: CehA/McbA family metallohydrolase, partial [Pirellulaceae bacterium]|nr:CehA/McbA family metallohydrolase [Pirellulaceae bacterium]
VQVLQADLVHLRSGMTREWTEFPETAAGEKLEIKFQATTNERQWALQLRQQDVKQNWRVTVNDQALGTLVIDENDQTLYFLVPPGTLADGENVLRIAAARTGAASDDIRVGQVRLHPRPVADVLVEGSVEIQVTDADSHQPLPCRLTILNAEGSLQTTAAASSDELAVRPGVIYAARGRARLGVPLGKYTIYAGRGFEYSLAKAEVAVGRGPAVPLMMEIRREVPTEGYVACDTHVHTVTFSGHGDATIAERMITLAGEGIELPIATDHNVHVDYRSHIAKAGLSEYFTPVMGNEVTTSVGHFNVFPIQLDAEPPDHKSKEWSAIFDGIFGTPGVKVAVLNHARDVHGGTRPFGPKLHNAVIGENLEGWPLRFNAMEVVNSGATQTDVLQLVHDWMGLLNAGRLITPVGASDSHDVARHFVGQGRTYIRAGDRNPGEIDVEQAVNNFLQGRVLVSYGLMAEMTVDSKYGSGELALPSGDGMSVVVRVRGPSWVKADQVMLFSNGRLVRHESIPTIETTRADGVKWESTYKLPPLKHDSYLVAVALGPGIDGPWWKTAKPYQPTSPDWEAHLIGCSGAIRLDGDGDGRWSSPRDYAQQAVAASGGDLKELVQSLGGYDEATAAQAAHLYQQTGKSLVAPESSEILKTAPEHVQRGFADYFKAWRESELARAEP